MPVELDITKEKSSLEWASISYKKNSAIKHADTIIVSSLTTRATKLTWRVEIPFINWLRKTWSN